MIQPKWDQLSRSTQRAINAPSQSQLQEAYNAGYYRALNEDLGGISGRAGANADYLRAKAKMELARKMAARNTPAARAARDAARVAKETRQIATHNAAMAKHVARNTTKGRIFANLARAGRIGRLFSIPGLVMGGAELGVAYGPDMSPTKATSMGRDRMVGTQ